MILEKISFVQWILNMPQYLQGKNKYYKNEYVVYKMFKGMYDGALSIWIVVYMLYYLLTYCITAIKINSIKCLIKLYRKSRNYRNCFALNNKFFWQVFGLWTSDIA